MSSACRSTCVALSDEVVSKSVSTIEERFFHNLLKASFSDEFVTDFGVLDVFN